MHASASKLALCSLLGFLLRPKKKPGKSLQAALCATEVGSPQAGVARTGWRGGVEVGVSAATHSPHKLWALGSGVRRCVVRDVCVCVCSPVLGYCVLVLPTLFSESTPALQGGSEKGKSVVHFFLRELCRVVENLTRRSPYKDAVL